MAGGGKRNQQQAITPLQPPDASSNYFPFISSLLQFGDELFLDSCVQFRFPYCGSVTEMEVNRLVLP